MKTIFISDLDGTLLTSQERISEFSLQNLNRMIDDNGLQFTYATARSLNSAAKACWGLRQNLPLILYNGALIMHPSTREVLYKNCFFEENLNFLKEMFLRYNVQPLVYSFRSGYERVSWIKGKETEGMLRYLKRRSGDDRLCAVLSVDELYEGDIFYFTCINARSELEGLYTEVSQCFGLRNIYEKETYQTDYWLEIMPEGTTKGDAARILKEKLGAEKIVSFGDANNDISLFAVSDECYAVKNASEILKSFATSVIGYSEEDSVCKFLLKNHNKY